MYKDESYDNKMYSKLVLNKHKVMEGPTYIYIPHL